MFVTKGLKMHKKLKLKAWIESLGDDGLPATYGLWIHPPVGSYEAFKVEGFFAL